MQNINDEKYKWLKHVNAITSYLATFPLHIPFNLINEFTKPNDIIMDNFAGRNTTGLVARVLKRRYIGNDLNPFAYVISKYKITKLNKNDLINKVNELQTKYNTNQPITPPLHNLDELLTYYHPNTLNQLIFLKNEIGLKWLENDDVNNGILAISLGLMHGQTHKDNSTIYFSVSTNSTISYTPKYVAKYREKNNLQPPNVNIFEKIKKRIEKKFFNELTEEYNAVFKYHNSTATLHFIPDQHVDLVITSPPYLNLVNYAETNWTKLWLLGYERTELKNTVKLDDKHKIAEYENFLVSYLNNIYNKLKNNALVCLVIGDINKLLKIEDLWDSIKNRVNYNFKELRKMDVNPNSKVLNVISNGKHNACKVENVLILQKK